MITSYIVHKIDLISIRAFINSFTNITYYYYCMSDLSCRKLTDVKKNKLKSIKVYYQMRHIKNHQAQA